MSSVLERLTKALEGHYQIVREIGRGGMATVYLARELATDRQVAIKVFHPDLTAASSPDRFLREIEVSGRLDHPGILALLDSGEADGLPYYVMPYIEGKSLADRIEEEGQLSIAEAIRIAREVAKALQHAHDQGIVHRDIKPDNILLSGNAVLVADFGIAHALDSSTGERLTATGLSVGTPAYMSPEQITSSKRIDGRADIYSLGCVFYAMLLGEPPFGGTSMQAILSRHLAEPVPQLRVVRPTIPRALEAVIQRALAKSPADRFATAAEFDAALDPQQLQSGSMADLMRTPSRNGRRWLIAGAVAIVLLALLAWLRPWSLTRSAGRAAVDPGLLAVAPFIPDDINDSTATSLATALPRLIAQRLPGDGGPRGLAIATDPRSELAAAKANGAGLLLEGRLAIEAGMVSITATLRRSVDDSLVTQVDRLTAPSDSLPMLLDQLVRELLIDHLGANPERSKALAALPLPILRKYLDARAAFAHGDFDRAADNFAAVLAVDSTCYPAALGLASRWYLWQSIPFTRGPLRLAREQLGRMSYADTAQLHSLQLWADDDTTRALSASERIQRLEFAARNDHAALPWFLLGERLFHDGPLLGVPDMLRRAEESFNSALRYNPDFVPAIGHLIDLAAARGDTEEVARLAPRYFALNPQGELSDYYRWRVAVALDDQATLKQVRDQITSFGPASLERIVDVAQLNGVDLQDATLAARTLWSQSGASGQARWAFIKQRELALNLGRPAEAARLLDRWRETGVTFRTRDGMAEVVDALFWGADTVAAATWVTDASSSTGTQAIAAGQSPDVKFRDCGVSIWRIMNGNGPIPASRLPVLTIPRKEPRTDIDVALCKATVAARLAWRNGSSDTLATLTRLDSLLGTAPPAITWLLAAGNITASELWERHGDLGRALRAVRRRVYITDIDEQRVLVALSTMLRDEVRLAMAVGDSSGAIAAARKYLALRQDPESALIPQADSVRQTLARLQR